MSSLVEQELERRLEMWSRLVELGGPEDVAASVVNELRIYYGGRGIWWNKEQTSSIGSPGVAVGLLHNGSSYPDDLTASGVVYHYPTTANTGTDSNEIDATKNACRLGLPVFIISQHGGRRTVYYGYVRDWDDEQQSFLIDFCRPTDAPPETQTEANPDSPFDTDGRHRRPTSTRRPPGQAKFAFRVKQRYGARCAACDLSLAAVIEAAHIVDVQHHGSMSSGNGLPLCPTHHRMWDQHLFGIRPKGFCLEPAPGYEAYELQLTRTALTHLDDSPSPEAIDWRWEKFRTANHDEPANQPLASRS